jgi:hypothetical protein
MITSSHFREGAGGGFPRVARLGRLSRARGDVFGELEVLLAMIVNEVRSGTLPLPPREVGGGNR